MTPSPSASSSDIFDQLGKVLERQGDAESWRAFQLSQLKLDATAVERVQRKRYLTEAENDLAPVLAALIHVATPVYKAAALGAEQHKQTKPT